MNEKSVTNYRICPQIEEQEVADFLFSIRDELYFKDRATAQEITALLYERGGVIAGYAKDKIVSVCGYFFGDPSDGYANKRVGFIYVAGLAKEFRGTKAFRNGLNFLMKTLQTFDVEEIRMHALETDKRLNSLYSSFTRPLRTELNRRGFKCVLYSSLIDDVLRRLNRRERRHVFDVTPIHRTVTSSRHIV
jgi:hypothetical protein